MPSTCRQYASTGSCKRGSKCRYVHQRSSEKPPPDTPATNPTIFHQGPTTARYPDSSRNTGSGFCDSPDVGVLLMRIAELEEELATARQVRLEAERDAEEAHEAQLEAERGEVEAIHAHQDAERRVLQAMQDAESRLNQAVQAQEVTEFKAKEAENKMHNAVKAWKAAELKSKETENEMSLEVRARHTAEMRAKDAEARVDDATRARKVAELATRTAVEEAKSAKRAQAEAEAKVKVPPARLARTPFIVNPAPTPNADVFLAAEAEAKVMRLPRTRFAPTLPPTIIYSVPTPNADAFLARKGAQSAAKEQVFTTQRIVSGSTLATFGPGLEVQSIICGFDNGLVEVKDIPYQATMDEITSLFTAINTRFCLIDVRQYENSSIVATVAVREDIKQRVVEAITGKSIRNQVVTAKALKTMVGYATPRHHTVVLSAVPGISQPPASFYDALESRLSSTPGIMSFQLSPHSAYRPGRGSRMAANAITAWFNSEAAANKACESLHHQSPTSDHNLHQCDAFRTRQESVKHALVVPLEQYDLYEAGKAIPKYGEMSASLKAEEFTIQTKNLGYEWFNGWQQWFDDEATKKFFASKLKQHSILIKWDCIVRTLTLYADSEQSMKQVSALLESFTTQSRKAVFYQTIDTYTAKSLVQSKQLEKLAEKVSLEVLRSRPVIKYQGGQSFFAARQLMEDIEMNQRTEDEIKQRCIVCRLEVSSSASIALTCGHQYCVPCLKRCILTAAEQCCLLIICSGDKTACKRPIAIPIIQSLFPPSVFQTLVEKIAQSYFERSDQFRYCITPGCTQVYRRSKEPNYISCSSCNATFCSSCHSKAHSSLSCDDWRVFNDQFSQGNKSEAQTATALPTVPSKDSELAQCLQAQEIAKSGSNANTSEGTDSCIVM
ncbi:hypothetical protein JOM56_008996 [Amanita muscaria]